MRILGIETSCDDTSAAIVDADRVIHAHVIHSQNRAHTHHGGVVPEIAAREHLLLLPDIIDRTLDQANMTYADLDGVAATSGPGLIGGVMVGMMAGKSIAAMHDIPFCAVNHLEGHALTPRLSDGLDFPYLLLLASGGHTQLIRVDGLGQYQTLGTTLDDAAGECFDKSAKLLGLGWPGGPALEVLATECPNPEQAITRFSMPDPLIGKQGCDFSFSGIKTALRTHVMTLTDQAEKPLQRSDSIDLACALQQAVTRHLSRQTKKAIGLCPDMPLVVAGGVAANTMIRQELEKLAETAGIAFHAPPLELCTDNGAMIAWVGVERLSLGLSSGFDHPARPRWPLSEIHISPAAIRSF